MLEKVDVEAVTDSDEDSGSDYENLFDNLAMDYNRFRKWHLVKG